ncbi:hypothetical protein Q9966_013887 [Columba livia]|nr:hypothetical protein Q9966_013887 [Columba livia]
MAERPPIRPRLAWQERPPSRPRVAWQEEVGAPQELRSPLDPNQVDVVQPLQIGATLPEENAHLQEDCEAKTTSLRSSPSAAHIMEFFAEDLQPCEKTDVVLVLIEAMRDSSTFDKEAARNMLNTVKRNCDFWLVDVPKITSCIHRNLESINTTAARQSVESLIVEMADKCPGEVVSTLLTIAPPGDRTALALWEVMFSVPQTLQNVLKELHIQLQDRHRRILYTHRDDASILRLAMLASSDLQDEAFAPMYQVSRFLRQRRPTLLSLLLRGMMTLSERHEMARKMKVMLPDLLWVLQYGNKAIKIKALVVFRNVMAQLERKEATPMAVLLAEFLPPFFDDELSQLREMSISLFRDLMKVLVGNNKRKTKNRVRLGLLPLFFHMSDQTQSVAKVAREGLLGAAELLKWKQLEHLVQTQQKWRIGECLLEQDRSRAQEFLIQSLPYLMDAQASLREAALRFIVVAFVCKMAERPPIRPRLAWQERPPSRPRVAWQEEVGAPQELRSPLDPNQVDVVQPLQIGTTLPEENAHLQEDCEAKTTSLRSSPSAAHIIEFFAENLQPCEKTDVVLVLIEAMRDSSTFDKEAARNMLNTVKRNCDFWLVDVPKITSCIHRNLESINTTAARQSVESLIVEMADKCPGEVVSTLLTIAPPGDRTALALWEVMFSVPQTLQNVLKELHIQLQDRHRRILYTHRDDASILRLAMLASSDLQDEAFAPMYQVSRFLRQRRPTLLSLLLRGMMTLSERHEMARKMKVMLPDLLWVLQYGNKAIKIKALVVFRNVMAQLERKEATPMAVLLAEFLPPFFDDELSQLREMSISLFRDLMKVLVGNNKRKTKNRVRLGLLPLFFHMSDQTQSVAKVAREGLLGAAELLKWKQLEHLVQTQQKWRIGECLLEQDRSRAQEFLIQSLPYLMDAQASLREAALRFIVVAFVCRMAERPPIRPRLAWQERPPSRPRVAWQEEVGAPQELRSPLDPNQVDVVQPLQIGTTLPEENAHLQEDCEAKTTSLRSSPSAAHIIEFFAEDLQPCEKTDVVLVLIEAMRDSSTFDKEAARNMLNTVKRNCDFWLVDVPKITSCIHRNLESINTTAARQSVESLIVEMADKCPGEVVSTLLTIAPPGDRTALALWEVMFSVPQTLQNVLKELHIQLQDRHRRILYTHRDDASILRLAMLASSDLQDEAFAPMYQVSRFLRQRRPTLLSLLLRGMMTLSERHEMARKMKVMLPDLLWVLQYGNKAIKIKALVVFRNVMAQLERKEATPMAVLLAEFLPPFFDDELSQLREMSISLFRDLMKVLVGNNKRKTKNRVRLGLLPLFFHMSDQTQSVAKVAREGLLGAAELLKWKQLEHLVQTQQKWRIGECLLEQDRSRAQEFLIQSLPYLMDAQASLREAALRFIGTTLPEENAHLQEDCEAKTTSLRSSPSAAHIIEFFAEDLQPCEKTDVVLVLIEAMRDSSTFDKEAARNMLNTVKRNCDFWLVDVPKITSCIHRNLESINTTAARQSVESLIVEMADKCPGEVVLTLLTIAPPGDRTALALWEVMFSVPQTLQNVLKELHIQLQDRHRRILYTHRDDASILRLAMLASSDLQDEAFAPMYQVSRFLRQRRPTLLSLLLRGMMTLSERHEMARKMKVMLPDLLWVLQYGNKAIKIKALVVFRNVMAQLERKEATPMAVLLAEFLPPFFDDELSQLREMSISLFRDLMKVLVGNNKRKTKNRVRLGLLPLFFHMSDQTQSVAKVAREGLLGAAELLKWKQLEHLVQTQQKWRIGECLLEQDRSRAQEFLIQSLPYLMDAQASLREAALRFIGTTLPEENAHLQEDCEAKTTSLRSSPSAAHIIEFFAEDLQPCEKTDVVLVLIEAMRDSSTFDKEAARNMLNTVKRNCDFWLVDVPKITSCIHRNLESINTTAARQSVESLIVEMADKCPGEVVLTLLTIAPPGDRTALALWEVMFSVPQTLQNVLKELHIQLQDRHRRILYTHRDDASILRLAMLASSDLQDEAFAPMYQVSRFLRQRRPTLLSLLLRGMMTLSERHEMARKMKVMLPDLLWVLQYGNKAIKIKALVVFRNVMAQLERKEATPMAVLLAEFLPPFFDDELSQLREMSISLFRDLMKVLVGNNKRKTKNRVRLGLLPLFFHMSDQTQSVAKVAREGLLGAAELLKWKQLEHLVQTQQKWRIGECLLEQDRSRAQEFLIQSLPYLMDAQASLREEALRFIVVAFVCKMAERPPIRPRLAWQERPPSRPRVAWQEEVGAPQELRSPLDPNQVDVVQPLQIGTTLPEENAHLQEDCEAKTTSLRSSPSAAHIIEFFAEDLQPCEKTDVVLVLIEAMRDSSTFDKEAARNMLNTVKRNCDFWLVDVPKITSCIHRNLESINTTAARQSVESLIVEMADKCPAEVVSTLLTIAPPGDRTALALWEVMFSVPQTLQNVLKELHIQLQDRHRRILYTHRDDASILRLAVGYWKKLLVPQELHGARSPTSSASCSLLACFQMLASSDLQDEAFAPMYQVSRFLRQRRPTLLSLLLRGMMTLSERHEMARKMKVMLPDLLWVLQYGNKAIKIKALVVFRNVMAQLERKEATPMAVLLAEFLPPFFNDELSQLREMSISLFRDLMKVLVGNNKRKTKNRVRLGLLPLFFHMSDQTQSVAKLEQDRSRAQEFLIQSLPYLMDAQASLREAALRFIVVAFVCKMAERPPIRPRLAWQERPPSRPRVAWQEEVGAPQELRSPLDPNQVDVVQPLQIGTTLPEENAHLQEDCEAKTTSLRSSPSAAHIIEFFAEDLQPCEKTDVVLVLIEAMRDSSTFDKEAARNMLNTVKRNCDFWLVDVPKITSCIHRNLESINTTAARQSVESLIVEMADKCPGEVVSTLLTIAPPGDRTALALWEVMFSVPQTLQNVLKELHIQLQDRHRRILYTHRDDASILRLAMLASSDLQDEAFAPMYQVSRFLRQRRPTLLSLLLRDMMTLSERHEMARKMKVMLPDLLWVLQYGNKAIKIKALVVFRNVMAQLERKEATPMAVLLAEFLPPFFDDELSQLREMSISLFRDLMKVLVGNNKRKTKNRVRLGLLPLFFHMSDQTQSVAKVAREGLLAAAELLKWKQLEHLVQTQQKWRIGECLLEQDRSRAQEFLIQSLPYLMDAQASLREAALRFIVVAFVCKMAERPPIRPRLAWQERPPSRPRVAWQEEVGAPQELRSPLDPNQVDVVQPLQIGTTLPEENAHLQEDCEAKTTSLRSSPSAAHIIEFFAEDLQPCEKTDVVLVLIEAMRDSSTFDKEAARNMLNTVKRNCDFWLVDVPKITSCIHRNLESINTTAARQSVESLIVEMADKCPGEVVSTLLTIAPPGDRTALALWEVMFSVPQTLQNVLKELHIQLQDRHRRILYTHRDDASILRLAMLASSDLQDEAFAPMYQVSRFLRQRRPTLLSLLLRDMMTLSERHEMARKMKVMLPDLLWVLQYGNKAIKIKALVVFRNVMAQLERKEATPMAVLLAEFLPPFFDDELSQLREMSISLFRDLMKVLVGNNKRKTKNRVRLGLLPLFFHMSDQTQSVAKVAREGLLAAAELLKWKQLEHLVQTQQKWRIGECLLEQDRSRAQEFLIQSLPYLMDAQASLREAALRFIVVAFVCKMAERPPIRPRLAWQERPPSRPRVAWQEEVGAPQELRSPLDPNQVDVVQPLQIGTTLPEENAHLQEDCEAKTTSLRSSPSAAHIIEFFAEDLQPCEKTDVVLVLIEAMRDSSTFDKEAARNMLNTVKRNCDFWLVDVPKITSCIHRNLESINTTAARQSVESLIVEMADKCPGEVVSTLLTIAPPGDRTALALWEVMFSVPQTLQNVLKELHIQLQDRHRRILYTHRDDASILHLAMLASSDLQDEAFAPMYQVSRFLRQRRPTLLSLLLRGMMTLSERHEMARKMKVMLPDLLWVLQYGNKAIKIKALVVFRNVMAQLERKEATPMAVLLAEFLPPFFDDELSQLREMSISLFRDLMKVLVGNNKRKTKNRVRLGLLPLFFHMSDQTQSVAKVAREGLLGAAELLKWKQLEHLVQTQQKWRIGECLLEQDRSRAQEFLIQSLPYLMDAQASLREAALRFIVVAFVCKMAERPPIRPRLAWQERPPSRPRVAWQEEVGAPQELRSPLDPNQVDVVQPLQIGTTLPEENAHLQEDCEAKTTSLRSSPSAAHIIEFFAEDLQPCEKTDVVLVLIEAMRDSSTFDKEAARNMLNTVKRNCDFWLVDVPKITSCIHRNLESINTTAARQSVESLIVEMADKCPGEVVSTLLTIAPPGDRTALALWEVMFSVPQTLQNVLKELHIQLQDRHRRILYTHRDDASILRLAMLASSDLQDEAFAPMYQVSRFLRQRRPTLLSLLLRGMMTLSERHEMARKMKVMLPDLLWVLQYGNKAIKIKALVVFRNVMAQLERKEATPMAVLLAEFLPPFFDDELSQLREMSISLFRDLMKVLVGNNKRKTKNRVRLGLLPLFFHMSDQTQSVAKVAREGLLGAAELLKWKQLEHLVQTQQKWRIGECLLEQDRSRAQEFLIQSLPYLMDAQASLREAALRFIVVAFVCKMAERPPIRPRLAWQERPPSRPRVAWQEEVGAPQELRSPLDPNQVDVVQPLQIGTTLPEENAHLQEDCEAKTTSLRSSPSAAHIIEFFAEDLQPCEKTDVVLVLIEAMRDSSTFDKEAARNMLNTVKRNCDFWLVDVPKITSCIHRNLESINTTAARQSVESLIVEMADKCPGEVVSTLLTIAPPGDRTALALWEVMFSVPQTLQNVLKELHIQLQDRHRRILYTHRDDASILRLAMLASSDLQDEAFAPMYQVSRFLRQRRPTLLSLLLRGMMTLSERHEMARKMKVMLPDLLWVLQYGNKAIKIKALVVFRNVMAQLERKEATPMAVLLAEFLPPFFDDELSQLREMSISLFRDLMKVLVGNNKRKTKNRVRLGLLPLFFHMSDQTQSVAKVAREGLLGAAELLKWKQLEHLVQTQQKWRIGECLLEQDRSRAQEFLTQSLPYLMDAQASLREEALRFIVVAFVCRMAERPPIRPRLAWQERPPSCPRVAWQEEVGAPQELRSPLDPNQVDVVQPLQIGTTLPEENAHLQEDCEAKTTSLRSSPSAAHIIEFFAEDLQPCEKTDVVLVLIEAMRDSSTFDKEAARNMLNTVKRNCDFWLVDVPKITSCIHRNLESINTTAARQSVESLIVEMADKCPGEVVSTLLTIAPPGDRTALALWEVMFSVPQTLQNVLKELHIQLQDRHRRILYTHRDDASILRLAMLASSDLQDEAFAPMYQVSRFLRQRRPTLLSLLLRGMMTLSERHEMARKMEVMLPDLLWVLQYGNKAIKIKALVVFRNVMAQLERKEATPMAVLLAEFLPPFFDDELSQLREMSISLFRDLMKVLVGNNKRKTKNRVRLGLLPLFFHMSDQTQSVAKVAREGLLGAAELLKWKQLEHLVQTQQKWRIGECLLEQDRSRAQEFLIQSLPYLMDAQASLREAALRFIVVAFVCRMAERPPIRPRLAWQERPPSCPRVAWQEEVGAPQELRSPLDPNQVDVVQPLQIGTTLPEENAHLQEDCEAKTTSLRSSPSAAHIIEFFAEDLQPCEKTDVVLVLIEAMRDSSTFDKEAARNMLNTVKRNCDFWLVDVPKITSCIHRNLESINTTAARQSVESLIVEMADKCPGEVVSTLLTIAPPGDRTALALWEVMFSVPQTLQNVLKELHIQLQDRHRRILYTHRDDASILRLAMLASSDLQDEAFAPMYQVSRFLRQRRPTLLSLLLRGMMTLSERHEMARKMKVMLPDLLWVLQYGNKAIKIKALVVFRNVMAQLERKEATPMAVLLAEFLPPFFDDELSQLREMSISLFRDLMKVLVGNNKRKTKNRVRLGLLPLFFHMSDQTQSVAKVAREGLLGAAELLKWKQLEHLVQTQQKWRIGECLLEQDRSRAQEFLIQSLPYLMDAQASLREAALRFIVVAFVCKMAERPPIRPRLAWQERPPSSPRVAWQEEVGAPQELRSPLDPNQVDVVQPLQIGTTLPEENAHLQEDCEAKTTSLRSSPSAAHIIEFFAEDLQPCEKTDVVLVLIEAMRDSSTFDKEAARNMLNTVKRNCDFWLVDVPKITSCIHRNLESINTTAARQSVESLIVEMADKCPGEVVSTLLTIAPPGDRTALALWEVMFSVPQTLQNVLKELHIQLQDRHRRILYTHRDDASILHLAMLASSDLQDEAFAPMYQVSRFLRQRRPTLLSLLLRGMMTLSERHEMARKMKVMLPDLLWVLQYGNKAIKIKALVVFRNVMAQLERKEATPMAVLLAEFLPPFFDDELSQLREMSISLFRDLMKVLVGNNKRKTKNRVRLGLLPLFFHMSDQTQSVAKVAREGLLGAAELLKWKQLEHLVQTQQKWRIGECLLEQDRSRAQEFLIQSLPYLMDAQASLREAALRFIAIQPLENDSEPSICFLATQTIVIVRSSWKRPRSRWILRALCCWR